MLKKIYFLMLIITPVIIFTDSAVQSAEKNLAANAADYICTKAREGKKTRLAVYPFTDKTGEASSDSKGYSTKIMGLIIDTKEFKVIDPEKVPEMIKEQEKGLTGLVDPETVAETGKMIGADALVFGIAASDSLQVRIIDASTGEVIGATLEQKSGKTKVTDEDFKSPEARRKFFNAELERNLNRLYVNKPFLYLYLTSDENELAELDNTFPDQMTRLKEQINNKGENKSKKLEKRKKRIANLRQEDPAFAKQIALARFTLISKMKNKRRNK